MWATSDLFDLPDAARQAFVEALLVLAHADGAVDLSESVFIQRVLDSADLEDEELEAARKVLEAPPPAEQLLKRLPNARSRKLLLQQLVLLAHVDGEYHEDERARVHEIATHAEVSEAWLGELEAWAAEGAAWKVRGEALLEG